MPFQSNVSITAIGNFVSSSIWLIVLIETIFTRSHILLIKINKLHKYFNKNYKKVPVQNTKF